MTETTEVRRRLPEMWKRLWAFAYKLTRNRADADDLTQETCLKALLCEHQYHQGTGLWSWLSTAMQTIWIDMARHKRIALDYHTEYPGLLLPTYATPADTNAVVADMERALEKLCDEHRQVVVRLMLGERQNEIARELGISNASACKYAALGRSRLEMLLA